MRREARGADLANLLAFVERRDGHATAASLHAVAELRRVADAVGASVFTIVTAADLSPAASDDLAAALGQAGADKLLVYEAPDHDGPALDVLCGRALLTAAQALRALLVVVPAGPVGPELGPPLAARLGAAWLPAADLGTDTGALIVRCRDGARQRALDPVAAERPVVASLARGPAPLGRPGLRAAEIEVVALDPPAEATPRVDVHDVEVDEADAATRATGLVILGPEVGVAAAGALERAAPEGVAIVGGRGVPSGHSAMSTACPGWVLSVGAPEIPCRLAPSSRVGVVLAPGDEAPFPADAILRVVADESMASLVEALASRARVASPAAKPEKP